jgi:hypothetical protein
MKAYICDRHKLLQLITDDYKNEHGIRRDFQLNGYKKTIQR